MGEAGSNGRRIGFHLTFEGVSYEVPSRSEKGKKARLLDDVTGYFSPGQLAALMGPSGSGKTTLLDVLAGRKTIGNITGEIRYAGFLPTVSFLRRYTGYVEQFDNLLSAFTVREMIMYTAELKRPVSESYESKKAAVADLLVKLRLVECQNVQIGSVMRRGISGGQAKRTNIGVSLVTNPHVLFLDEPTSGLDSRTANEVVTVVRDLTREGMTVCATIHSPSSYAYNLFDSVMLLLHGQTVYFGSRTQATGYFESLVTDGQRRIEGDSEAEWIVDIVVCASGTKQAAEMTATYKQSALRKAAETEVQSMLSETTLLGEDEFKHICQQKATVVPFWHSLKTLVKYRSVRNLLSSKFLVPRLLSKFIAMILQSTIYWGIGDDYVMENFTSVVGLLFIAMVAPVFSTNTYLPNLILERPVFYRERYDGLYHVITYLIARMLDELILILFASLVYTSVTFYSASLQGSFLVYWSIYLGSCAAGVCIAYAVAAAAPTLDSANAALPTYATTMIVFAGYVVRYENIPLYYRWYTNIDMLYYALNALLSNQFDTEEGRKMQIEVAEGEKIGVLEYFSVEDVDVGRNVAIVFLFSLAYSVIAYLALSFCSHQRR